MAPLSYRLEKGIYAIWHAFIVFLLFKFSQQDYIDFAQSMGWEASTGKLLSGLFTIYGLWQLCLLFIHGFVNAICGVILPYFNFGSYRKLWMFHVAYAQGRGVELEPISGYRNIDDVIRFREAKMGAISTSEGAELLVETSALDQIAGMTGGSYGRNHKQAAQSLNAKLGAMSQRQGLEYMRGRQL